MQCRFDFLGQDLERWRGALNDPSQSRPAPSRRRPTGQLVKSLISGRTRDAVSLGALLAIMEDCDQRLRFSLALNEESIVLLFGTKGDTDPESYAGIINAGMLGV